MDIKQDAVTARSNAQDAFNYAYDARNKSDKLLKNLTDINDKIWIILNDDQPTPVMVRDLAEEVLNKQMNLKPEAIESLAADIDKIVGSLTDSDKILSDTASDLRRAQDLEDQANRAKELAIEKQTQAGKVFNYVLFFIYSIN